MHEFSLAQDIVNIVHESVPGGQLAAVRSIRVDIGRMAGVVADSLEFCFQALVAETPLRQACLELRTIPLRLACADCRETLECPDDVFACPACGGRRTTVVTGMELRVAAVELVDDPKEAE